MWIVIPTDTCFPMGINFLQPDTWVFPIQYDSPDDFITDFLADELNFLFHKDFEVWILNISTGQSLSFWDLLAQYKDKNAQTESALIPPSEK